MKTYTAYLANKLVMDVSEAFYKRCCRNSTTFPNEMIVDRENGYAYNKSNINYIKVEGDDEEPEPEPEPVPEPPPEIKEGETSPPTKLDYGVKDLTLTKLRQYAYSQFKDSETPLTREKINTMSREDLFAALRG